MPLSPASGAIWVVPAYGGFPGRLKSVLVGRPLEYPRTKKMIETLGYGPNNVGSSANADLRRYARWEYGSADAGWLFAGVRQNHRRAAGTWTLRLRYWLNSFPGFAGFEAPRTDGGARNGGMKKDTQGHTRPGCP